MRTSADAPLGKPSKAKVSIGADEDLNAWDFIRVGLALTVVAIAVLAACGRYDADFILLPLFVLRSPRSRSGEGSLSSPSPPCSFRECGVPGCVAAQRVARRLSAPGMTGSTAWVRDKRRPSRAPRIDGCRGRQRNKTPRLTGLYGAPADLTAAGVANPVGTPALPSRTSLLCPTKSRRSNCKAGLHRRRSRSGVSSTTGRNSRSTMIQRPGTSTLRTVSRRMTMPSSGRPAPIAISIRIDRSGVLGKQVQDVLPSRPRRFRPGASATVGPEAIPSEPTCMDHLRSPMTERSSCPRWTAFESPGRARTAGAI